MKKEDAAPCPRIRLDLIKIFYPPIGLSLSWQKTLSVQDLGLRGSIVGRFTNIRWFLPRTILSFAYITDTIITCC